MPEPTTGPDELDQARIGEIRTKIARWAPQGASDLMFDLATISALLNAYDQIAARAAAAEAAVHRVREYITKRDDELLSYRDTVLNDGRRESRASGFGRAASELRSILPMLTAAAEPHLPADPTHHYPVRDLSGEPLPADLEWAIEDDGYWAERMRRYGLNPETLPMPAPTEGGAR